MEPLSFKHPYEKIILIGLFVLFVIALFMNLGSYPLYLEEPRRALIAMEMLINKNLFVPTEYGEFYYRKPPLWNWMIILGWKIFGINEFGTRFFGILSYLSIGISIFWLCRKYVSEKFAYYAVFFFLIMSDGIFYITVVTGEIDVFYAAITFAMFVAIFHFFEKEEYYRLFIVVYFLTALGTLTKGIPSLVFTAFTLLAIFVDRRRFWKLFHPGHFVGIGLLTVIVGGYLYIYDQYHDVNALLFSEKDSIFAQTSDKSFLASGISNIINHLVSFPFVFASKIVPAIFLLLFLFQRGMRKGIMSQPMIRYFLIAFLVNIIVYWLSPASRSRYLYMLFPFVTTILVYSFYINKQKWRNTVLQYINFILMGGLTLALFLLPFIKPAVFKDISGYEVPALIMAFFSLGAFFYYYRNRQLVLMPLIVIMITIRVVYDFTVLELRSANTNRQIRKDDGAKIAAIVKDKPIYMYRETVDYKQRVFYIERETWQIVGYKNESDTHNYFFVDEKYLQDTESYISLFEHTDKGVTTHLVKFKRKID